MTQRVEEERVATVLSVCLRGLWSFFSAMWASGEIFRVSSWTGSLYVVGWAVWVVLYSLMNDNLWPDSTRICSQTPVFHTKADTFSCFFILLPAPHTLMKGYILDLENFIVANNSIFRESDLISLFSGEKIWSGRWWPTVGRGKRNRGY